MNLQARPYHTPNDLAQMRHLLMIGSQSGITASYMHPGCLDWATHCPPDEAANRRNLRLWEVVDSGAPTLVAWAMLYAHEGTFDLFVHPSIYDTPTHASVMDEYVVWAAGRAREAGVQKLSPFWVYDYDKVTDCLLQERGFVPIQADPPVPLFARALDELPTIALPPGFTVQGVRSAEEGRQRAEVACAAFSPHTDWAPYWTAYQQFMRSAVYDSERDLLVHAPDGRGAAVCTIWFDPVNRVGLFEPVATHPDFQGQGLGKAVMAEGLRRMMAAGMERAILGFDPNNVAALRLYTALGFRAICNFALYAKAV